MKELASRVVETLFTVMKFPIILFLLLYASKFLDVSMDRNTWDFERQKIIRWAKTTLELRE
jgi:hypothetical protein